MPRLVLRIPFALAALGAILFGTAGRWDLPFVWGYLAVNAGVMVAGALLIDRGLLRERARPGSGGVDRSLRFTVLPFFGAHLVVAGLDVGRFHWSGELPAGWQLAALLGLALSMSLSVWSMHANRFFSPVVRIQSERGHQVITSGPYRWVRHPGYLAVFGAILCGGPALGSWWSVLVVSPMVPLIIRRTIIEDRYLHQHLEGYVEYAEHVRYRLVPWIW